MHSVSYEIKGLSGQCTGEVVGEVDRAEESGVPGPEEVAYYLDHKRVLLRDDRVTPDCLFITLTPERNCVTNKGLSSGRIPGRKSVF